MTQVHTTTRRRVFGVHFEALESTSIAVLVLLALAPPLVLIAAAVPLKYAAAVAAVEAVPIAAALGTRASIGTLLGVAFVSPPLMQFLAQGGPEGIPPIAVAPLFGGELILLFLGLRAKLRVEGAGFHVGPMELAFLLAMIYAAVVGFVGQGDRRVWMSELAETVNLVIIIWLLRLNRVQFSDLKPMVIIGHLMAAPFFASYLLREFGQYRLDFFFSLVSAMVPLTVAVILNVPMQKTTRLLLGVSSAAMLVATAAAGIRGSTLIAILATGFVVLFNLKRLGTTSTLIGIFGFLAVLALQPVIIGIVDQVAPEALERFRTAADSPTLSVRLLEAQDAFEAFKERPTGRGFGAVLVTRHEIVFGAAGITIEYGPTTYIHNSYAWYLAKTGFIGFIALIVMVIGALLAAVQRLPSGAAAPALACALILAHLAGAWGGPALHNIFQTEWLALAIYLARETPALAPDPTNDVPAPPPGRTHALHGAAR